jgi:hypothetical protein
MTIAEIDSASATATATRPASVTITLGPLTASSVCIFVGASARTDTQTGWGLKVPKCNGVEMHPARNDSGALGGGGDGSASIYFLNLGDVTAHSPVIVVTADTSDSEIALQATAVAVSGGSNILIELLRDHDGSVSTTTATSSSNTVNTLSSDLTFACLCFDQTAASAAAASDGQTKVTGISTSVGSDMAHVVGHKLATTASTDDGWDTFSSAVAHATASFRANYCGTVLEFSTDNDWVSITPAVSLSGDFTVEGWLKLNPAPIDNNDAFVGGIGWAADINFWDSTMRLFNGSDDSITAVTPVALNTWVHVAVTRSGQDYSAYIDGQLDATNNHSWSDPFVIAGMSTGATGTTFRGQMKDIRAWNVARTDDEIEENYNKTVDPSHPNLVGYWRFNDPIGSQTVTDSSSAGNHGLLGPDATTTDDPAQIENGAPSELTETCGYFDDDIAAVVHEY